MSSPNCRVQARCLARLYPLTSGSVEFEGHDISTLSRRELHDPQAVWAVIKEESLKSAPATAAH